MLFPSSSGVKSHIWCFSRGKRWWRPLNASRSGEGIDNSPSSLVTCFIRQGCVKTNFDSLVNRNRLDSLAALLSFCSIDSSDDIKKNTSCVPVSHFYYRCVCELCVRRRMHVPMHPCSSESTLAYLCLYLWVFPEQSWGEQQLAAVLSPRQH